MVEKEDKLTSGLPKDSSVLETILGIILFFIYAVTFGFINIMIFDMLIAVFMIFLFFILLAMAIALRAMHQSTTALLADYNKNCQWSIRVAMSDNKASQ